MESKLYQIQNGAVTLHLDMERDGTTFEFRGFTLDGDENFYQPYRSIYDDAPIEGKTRVALDSYLMDKLKSQADEQLTEYLDQHIHDVSIYETRTEELDRLWQTAGEEPCMRLYRDMRWSRVIDGVVGLEINQMVCLYDFVRKEILGYREAYGNKPLDVTLLYVFYGGYLDQKLALEQYRCGFAPPVYEELAKLNQFLKGKKSVKLVMKDGAVHEYKHHNGNEVCVRNLLCFYPENVAEPFFLEDSYDLKPGWKGKRPVSDLDHLQYGREKHTIDPAVLKQFCT